MSDTRAKLAVTRKEAADMYSVGVNVISEAIHSGALRAVRPGGGRQFRISVDDLKSWFEALPEA